MSKTLANKAWQDCKLAYGIARDRCLIARSEIKDSQLLENYLERVRILDQKETVFMHVVGFLVGNYTTYCPLQNQLDALDILINDKLNFFF